MVKEKPFAYHVAGMGDETNGVFKSLADVVRLSVQWVPDDIEIYACYGENRQEVVPEENYSVQKLATREEALKFIHERDADIKKAEKRGKAATLASLAGAWRCSPDDTEEKQIKDYIASSPRVWLPLEKIVEI